LSGLHTGANAARLACFSKRKTEESGVHSLTAIACETQLGSNAWFKSLLTHRFVFLLMHFLFEGVGECWGCTLAPTQQGWPVFYSETEES
jgi:hypothetical protein